MLPRAGNLLLSSLRAAAARDAACAASSTPCSGLRGLMTSVPSPGGSCVYRCCAVLPPKTCAWRISAALHGCCLRPRLLACARDGGTGDGQPKTVTLIPGDGIGPELCKSMTDVVDALGAPIVWERFDSLSGSTPDGKPRKLVPRDVMESIKKNGVCIKGTLFTPLDMNNTDTQSLNVQLRKELDLHVNLVHGFNVPGLKSRYEGLDIVVIRENTEGEYSGLEHEAVEGVVESLKVITYDKSLRTAEYAFEFALLNNRKKVTAVHKANIMKLGDGMFLKATREVAKKYPKIIYDEMIVDNTCMQLVSKPHQFDVMVTPNLYGNLVANVVAGLCGGYGVVPGGNVGAGAAVFEQGARHVARDQAGKGTANPTALLLSASMMMRHMSFHSFSSRLENAVLKVYSDGQAAVLTPDVGGTGTTLTFTNAVIKNL